MELSPPPTPDPGGRRRANNGSRGRSTYTLKFKFRLGRGCCHVAMLPLARHRELDITY
jgi:hypothetical protein